MASGIRARDFQNKHGFMQIWGFADLLWKTDALLGQQKVEAEREKGLEMLLKGARRAAMRTQRRQPTADFIDRSPPDEE